MLLWGLFGLVYCCAIPGLALLSRLPVAGSSLTLAPLVVGLSLVTNHLLVLALFYAGLYTPTTVVPLTLTLTLLAMWGVLQRFYADTGTSRSETPPLPASNFDAICISLLVVSAGYHIVRAIADFGAIFSLWDAVVSWNPWAVDWARNSRPMGSYDYPQLIPTIWSLTYLLIGTSDIQVFAKAISAWFPVVAAVAFAGMWREQRNIIGPAAAVVFTLLLMPVRLLAISGYVEIPTSVMALVGYYAGWLATLREGREAKAFILIGAAVAAGAGACKQGGLYHAIFYPVFIALIHPRGVAKRWNVIAAAGLVVTVLAVAYSLRFYTFFAMREASIAPVLMFDFHGQMTLWEKIGRALGFLTTQWLTPKLLLPLTVLWTIALFSSLGRVLLLGGCLPPLLFYVCFFGYDVRNSLFCMTFLAWAAGLGAQHILVHWIAPRWPVLGNASRWPGALSWSRTLCGVSLARLTLALSVGLAAVAASAIVQARGYPDIAFFNAHQRRYSHEIGLKRLNKEILDAIATRQISGRILTNYSMLNYIAETKPLYLQVDDPNRFTGIEQQIMRVAPDVVLDINSASGASAAELRRLQTAGLLTLIKEFPGWWRLYRVNAAR